MTVTSIAILAVLNHILTCLIERPPVDEAMMQRNLFLTDVNSETLQALSEMDTSDRQDDSAASRVYLDT